ncbi:MAG: hypothetical protein RJA33_1187 [Actinomycetota bacterium]|jgi:diaminohydroxyphosphoribosylaminopyrimidine deaminase/5-amino-6-(5-phosphoribosylamino)uracil reductase
MIDIDSAYAHLYSLCSSVLGKSAPNPNVAAAIYSSEGVLISEGVHNPEISIDHAEVVAIEAAGVSARGATIIVSLEPCNHTGQTGACVDAIIAAGISTVIFAVKDPNPLASGGEARLRDAGIQVQYVENAPLREVQGAWLHRIESGRPYFIWKVATSLDGKIAAIDGSSQWISSPESREDVQNLRTHADAILVGTGTALADNPTLRPRIEGAKAPLRIVMGTREVPSHFNLHDELSKTLFIRSNEVSDLLNALKDLPVNTVLVEAGPTLGSALFAAGVIDELVIYQASTLIGEGRSWLEDIGVATINDAYKLPAPTITSCGPDLKFEYRLRGK